MFHDPADHGLEPAEARHVAAPAGDEDFKQVDMRSLQPAPAFVPPPAPAPSPRRFAAVVDRVGATASMLCAVHCALLPFVLALLPLIGLEFLAGHTFERIFVGCAAALACASILTAYRRHRRPHALFLMVPGIALLCAGVVVNLDLHVIVHTACVVTGGVLVASAHVTNLVLAHRHHLSCDHP
ncbi:MAG: MerC domain-containing protein [Rhodanobacteraceae bacterium]